MQVLKEKCLNYRYNNNKFNNNNIIKIKIKIKIIKDKVHLLELFLLKI